MPPSSASRARARVLVAKVSRLRTLEKKPPAAKVEQTGDGLPGWLRDRIESTAIPADPDSYFRDVVAALAACGWDFARITIKIAGRAWIPKCYGSHLSHLREWAIPVAVAQARMIQARSIDEPAPDDVAASDLRAVQRAIASGRWRENSQAKEWAGHAVASVIGLDASNKAHKAKISGLLKTWIENGMLVVVDGLDDSRRTRSFIEVGTSADA